MQYIYIVYIYYILWILNFGLISLFQALYHFDTLGGHGGYKGRTVMVVMVDTWILGMDTIEASVEVSCAGSS